MEQPGGRECTPKGSFLRQKLLDDRIGFSGYAQIYLGSGALGHQAQMPVLLQEKEILIKADGYLSIVLQHELDHFKGVLFYDHINQKDPFYQDPDALIIE